MSNSTQSDSTQSDINSAQNPMSANTAQENEHDREIRIGYLIPEFPGQTDIFFWRERQALAELGIETKIISTRRPPQGIISHTWFREAQNMTVYLFPLGLQDMAIVVAELLKAGIPQWLRCFKVILQAEDVSLTGKLRLAALIPFAAKLIWLARHQSWSHIHVTTCGDSANIAMFASILSNITYSLSLLGPELETYGPNQKQKWQYTAFGIFQAEKLQRDVEKKLDGYLPKDIAFAPVGVNIDVMKRQDPYKVWEQQEPCKIYTCGRLNPVKGHNYVIEALEILRQQGVDAYLQIAGEDEQGGSGYRRVIEALIQEKGLGDYVTLLGAVSEERNRQAYQEAHIYAMGSLNETAGAVAAMEAMAMEVPVVMTNVGATSELIDHGVDALLVQPQQPQELAAAIMQVLSDPDLALRLGKAAREKIVTKFSHRRSATQIAAYLRKMTLETRSERQT